MTPTPIPAEFTCHLRAIGCPHCIHLTHGVEAPWQYVDSAQFERHLKQEMHLTCQKTLCGKEFLASAALLSEQDPRFVRPRDADGKVIDPMWCLISCPACLAKEGKRRWVDAWAASFLLAYAYNNPYPCPSCQQVLDGKQFFFRHGWDNETFTFRH